MKKELANKIPKKCVDMRPQCDFCNKKADYNRQNEWQLYSIDKKGDYGELEDSWDGEDSNDICEKCYKAGN